MSNEEMLARIIADTIKEQLAPLRTRIENLEAKNVRLEAALEQRNFAYVGSFKEGATYSPGMFVTHSGNIWHCQFRTTSRPGNGDAAWTLAVRAGRDGKDGKDAARSRAG